MQLIRLPGGRLAGVDNGTPMERFLRYCRFDPETGCVLWTGGQTKGRGHNVPYGAFWFEGRRWFAHRWAAKHIHNLDIDDLQVDHCCPNVARPNTLCVEHLQALTPAKNRELQWRRHYVHLQVGLITYEDAYGPEPEPIEQIPFYTEPAWLGALCERS